MTSKKTPAKKGNAVPSTEVHDYGDMSGGGYENTSQDDFSIPFIGVLQSNSAAVEEDEDGTVKAGQLINTVTGETTSELEVIPCLTEHLFVEWVPRDKGGGFVARHELDSDVVKAAREASGGKFGKLSTPEGNDLIETFYWYCIVVEDGNINTEPSEFAILAFTSTKIRVHKHALQRMRMVKGRPPLFANRVMLSTKKEKNDKGSFYNLVAKPAVNDSPIDSLIPPVLDGQPHPMLVAAKHFNEQIHQGVAKADYSGSADATGSGDGDDTPF